MRAKILIVGGGVMGASIAMRAATRTDPLANPVVLLEKDEMGAGSSGRSGAILRQYYADRTVAMMARDSLREYASFGVRTGRRIGFRRTGVLTITRGAGGLAELHRNVECMQSVGIAAQLVDAREIRELIPGIEVGDDVEGVWERHGGFVDAQRTVREFTALARSQGAVTRLGVAVDRLIVEDGRVVGAAAGDDEYRAEHVVVAAGPWSKALLASAGVDLPLRIVRPESHFVSMPQPEEGMLDMEKTWTNLQVDMSDPHEREEESQDAEAGVPHMHPVVIDLENESYCRCDPMQWRTRVGRTTYEQDAVLEAPEELDEAVAPEMREWARKVLVARLPSYADLPDAGAQAAWYTLTPDAQATIGPVPGLEGLFVVTGFSGHGFKLAPSIGEGVAQMLFGEPVSALEPEFFAPGRFAAEPVWGGRFGL